MMQQPFLWGQGGQKLTPEQLERERELAEAALGRAGDYSPVGHWTQGAARVLDTLGGVMRQRRVDQGDRAAMEGAAQMARVREMMGEQGDPQSEVIRALLAQGGL